MITLPNGLFHLVKSWYRLETNSRSVDYIPIGLQARTADAAWFLSRQWVTSEFQGEDAGSIMKTEIEYTTESVDLYAAKDQPYQPISTMPLEVLIEREAIAWDWKMKVRAGQHLERIVAQRPGPSSSTDIETLRKKYPLVLTPENVGETDEASLRYIRLIEGKVIDGQKFYEDRSSTSDPELLAVRNEFDNWYNTLFSQPNGKNTFWQSKTLEYNFNVRTPEQSEMSSEHYRNGDLEWYNATLKSASPIIGQSIQGAFPPLMPTRVTFAGMAHPRWWTMEDSVIDFGKMEVAKSELIKTMVMNFMLIHGDDWFVVPLPLPTGSLTEVLKITTTDVFGVPLEVLNGRVNDKEPLKRWDLFSLSKHNEPTQNADRDYVYLPPSSGFREESESWEEIMFIRDENANRVFGIERIAPNIWGTPVSARQWYDEKRRRSQEQAPPSVAKSKDQIGLEFKLATSVPEHWIPYDPTRMPGSNSQIYLTQSRLPNVDANIIGELGLNNLVAPRTRVLSESRILNEESITRAGVLVTLNKQRMRWTDGKTYVWLGRSVVTGRGEGSSGLKFDVVNSNAS